MQWWKGHCIPLISNTPYTYTYTRPSTFSTAPQLHDFAEPQCRTTARVTQFSNIRMFEEDYNINSKK